MKKTSHETEIHPKQKIKVPLKFTKPNQETISDNYDKYISRPMLSKKYPTFKSIQIVACRPKSRSRNYVYEIEEQIFSATNTTEKSSTPQKSAPDFGRYKKRSRDN